MSGKELIKLLQQHCWTLDRIQGSHHIMIKQGRQPLSVAVHANRDLPTGLVHRILKEGGIR